MVVGAGMAVGVSVEEWSAPEVVVGMPEDKAMGTAS